MTTTYRPVTDHDVADRLAVAIKYRGKADARRSFITTCREGSHPSDVEIELAAWARGMTSDPKVKAVPQHTRTDAAGGPMQLARHLAHCDEATQ